MHLISKPQPVIKRFGALIVVCR